MNDAYANAKSKLTRYWNIANIPQKISLNIIYVV